jgi:RNAse (barnase) inhibitor barstar
MNEIGPHVRGAFPWLRSGPLWRIHADAEPDLDRFIEASGYRRIDLDGARMTGRAAAHAELARLLQFPDWYGGNWDAFHDCFGGFVSANGGARVAVVWHDLDVMAAAAPTTAVEVGWALLTEAFEHRWATTGRPTIWMDVFAVGRGDDFDRPGDAS